MRRFLLALLCLPACSTPTSTTVVACAADGTCPPGSHCAAGLCADGAPEDVASGDATAAGADGDAGGGEDTGAGMCIPDLSGGPSPRGESYGGFASGRLIVHSGDEGVAQNCNPSPKPVADGWRFSPCNGWSPESGDAPPPRARAASTGDGDGRLWVFGGRWRTAASGSYTLRNDTWHWSAAAGWERLDDGTTGGPNGRSSTVLGVDPTTGFLWLHGGNGSTNGLAFTPLADTWFLDPAFGGWQKKQTSGKAPTARIMHAGAVTRDGKYLVVFGGGDANAFQGPFFADTWRLDLQTGAWQQIATSGPRPAARILASMVATGESRVVLFGGHDDGAVGNRNDLWQLDAGQGTWTLLRAGDLGSDGSPDTIYAKPNGVCDFPADFMQLDMDGPERRESALLSWDEAGQRIWLFGGKSDCGTLRDVWTFDTKTATWSVRDDTPKGWSCGRYVSPCSHLCAG